MVKHPEITKEDRAELKSRLAEATANLEAYVARLHDEVTIPGTEVMMVADEPFSPDPADGVDTLTSVAEIKAAERLADDAQVAKQKLDRQAETAADLLITQAARLATSVEGLRLAVLNLEHRTVMTEERTSMSEERANLIASRNGRNWVKPAVLVLGVVQVTTAATVVWVYLKPKAT